MISNILSYCLIKYLYIIKPSILIFGLKICMPYPLKINMNLYPQTQYVLEKDNSLGILHTPLRKSQNEKIEKEKKKQKKQN